jgi:mutator protein MutT
MKPVDVIALIIYKDGKILVEKRKPTKIDDPGKVIIPSGHVEKGETLEEACKRELKEEVDLECNNFKFIVKLPNETPREKQMIHFFSCENWRGTPKPLDAEKILWITSKELDTIDYEIDIKAIRKFFENYSFK